MMRNWPAGFCANCWRAHPEIEIVAECANGFEAVKAVAETTPDLLFLDVQMPKLDGFEVLELIEPSQAPVVIFVTAYDQYAMRAFDAHAVDYLLKPFSAERFERALERARSRLGERRMPPALATEARPAGERPAAHRGEGRHARARDSPRQAGLRGGPGRLRGAAQRRQELPEAAAHRQPGSRCSTRPRFVRIHRSAIVNLERVARIEPYGKESRIAILTDGTRLPVSRSGYARLLEAMGDSQGNRNTTR